MFGGNREGVVHPQSVKLWHVGGLFSRIDFVDDEEEGFRGTPQNAGEFLVRSCNPGPTVNDEEDDRGAFNGNLGLLENVLWNVTLFTGKDAAGVYNFVGAP